MAHVDWYVEGKVFGNCNCNYGCPCQFEALPTHGNCTGFEVLHIDKGHFGETDLAGLRTGLLYAWPGPIFEGNGAMQTIIDERADEAQRDALRRVLHGEETGVTWRLGQRVCVRLATVDLVALELDLEVVERV